MDFLDRRVLSPARDQGRQLRRGGQGHGGLNNATGATQKTQNRLMPDRPPSSPGTPAAAVVDRSRGLIPRTCATARSSSSRTSHLRDHVPDGHRAVAHRQLVDGDPTRCRVPRDTWIAH
jgi:hypothetical protein